MASSLLAFESVLLHASHESPILQYTLPAYFSDAQPEPFVHSQVTSVVVISETAPDARLFIT